MTTDADQRPLISEEREQRLRDVFPLEMSPEEYAGRHGATILVFSMHQYRYRDPVLQTWLQRLGEILVTHGQLAHFQEQYLTAEELADIRAAEDVDEDACWCMSDGGT